MNSSNDSSPINFPKKVILDPSSQEDFKFLTQNVEGGRVIHLEVMPESGVTMHSMKHVAQLAAVKEAFGAAINVYSKVKESNTMCKRSLETAESALQGVTAKTAPVQRHIQTPMMTVDKMLLKGIVQAEKTVPAITLPPQQMLEKTKKCVNTTMKPCADGFNAAKSYSANVIRKVLATSLLALPDSLLPEGIDRDKLSAERAQKEVFEDAK